MFAGEISWRLRHRKCFGQTMFVGMPGLSPVPELATSLFQLCKRSGGTSLTKSGKIFAKRSFCRTDLEHGICKRNYLWFCATNLLHDSSAVSLPIPSLLKIHDQLETLFSFSLVKEHHSQSTVHPTPWNVRGLRVCFQNTGCCGRRELPDIKALNKKCLGVWRKGNGWEINNFLVISFNIYRNNPIKGVSILWPVHLWQTNQMYLDCWQRSSPTAATNFTWGKVNN